MEKHDQEVHFLMTKGEKNRVREKMDEMGIRNMGAYLRKMALDGYIVSLDLEDLKEMVRQLRICNNNLNQYTKKAHETNNMYKQDIDDIGKRLEEIWTKSREIIVRLSSIQ